MPNSSKNILGRITPKHFLKNYWQKKPLLIRQALPGYQCPITPEELAGHACEEGVESRLVIEKHGAYPWQVKHGPLTRKDFRKLPSRHWTLLVQRVDHFAPEISALLDHFRFVPNWRIDDVMISYAPKHGSVGPHLDSYDVFLLQGMGQRRWQINTSDYSTADFIPDLDLRILKKFKPQKEWILEPGDMLYLPPGVAHHGVALDPCLTLSIGFLAPAQSELITHFAEATIAGTCHEQRYSDPDLAFQDHSGEITAKALARIRKLMLDAFGNESMTDEWFGRFITGQHHDSVENDSRPITLKKFNSRFKKATVLRRTGSCRCAYINNANKVTLFVNGTAYNLGKKDLSAVRLITGDSSIPVDRLQASGYSGRFMKLLCDLHNQEIFSFD